MKTSLKSITSALLLVSLTGCAITSGGHPRYISGFVQKENGERVKNAEIELYATPCSLLTIWESIFMASRRMGYSYTGESGEFTIQVPSGETLEMMLKPWFVVSGNQYEWIEIPTAVGPKRRKIIRVVKKDGLNLFSKNVITVPNSFTTPEKPDFKDRGSIFNDYLGNGRSTFRPVGITPLP